MLNDSQGFIYPKVDTKRCIECGLCRKVCPFITAPTKERPIYSSFASWNRDDSVRKESSSGGIFYELANLTIKKGGVVFGAAFDERWNVYHKVAETEEEIKPLLTSKYVQSNTGNTFKKVKYNLDKGKCVLFVGTPCQIAGLKKFLQKDYQNLLSVEVICHGVPSPLIWQDYLHNNFVIKQIKFISFRDKSHSWENFGLRIETDKTTIIESQSKNPFIRGFLNNYYLRPSCYACKTKNGHSSSDISLGDLWGVDKFKASINDHKGLSLIFTHNLNAHKIISSLASINSIEINHLDALQYNPAYFKSVEKPFEYYLFWKLYRRYGINALDLSLNFNLSLFYKLIRRLYYIFRKYRNIQ